MFFNCLPIITIMSILIALFFQRKRHGVSKQTPFEHVTLVNTALFKKLTITKDIEAKPGQRIPSGTTKLEIRNAGMVSDILETKNNILHEHLVFQCYKAFYGQIRIK